MRRTLWLAADMESAIVLTVTAFLHKLTAYWVVRCQQIMIMTSLPLAVHCESMNETADPYPLHPMVGWLDASTTKCSLCVQSASPNGMPSSTDIPRGVLAAPVIPYACNM
jgi:hypothetical protein